MEIALETPFRLPRPSGAATMRPVSTNELTDAELIIRTGDGDRGAFEALYRRYSRPVFGLALRRLGDRGRAEDAVQETFASIWRAARTYKPERGPGGPWLYAVARNAIVDRSRARSETPVETPEEESPADGPAAPPRRCAARDRGRHCPRRRLRRLRRRPGRPRQVHHLQEPPDARDGDRPDSVGDDRRRRHRPERQLAAAGRAAEPAEPSARRLLRDVPDEARQARRDLRHLRHLGEQLDRAAERALQPQALRRLGRHPPPAGLAPRPGRADDLGC